MTSNERIEETPKMIEKTTEALWRVLWALVYLIFIPTLVAVLFFFIFTFIIGFFFGIDDFIISLALSAIMFLVSILIFYRPFDKYRKKSIFLNKTNNPRARIHILFLITLISLIYTPIFLIFIPQYQVQLNLLPLITFVLTYNSIYLYFYSQPIDFFSISESIFKHFNKLKDSIKQPYNLIILANYIVHVAFLSITFDMQIPILELNTGMSWSLDISWSLAFISNVIFYLIALKATKPHIKIIEESISTQESFLEDLVLYKQAFVKSIVRLDFLVLIQIPVGVLSVFLRSMGPNAIINAIFITIILLIFNFKLDIYLKSYYFKHLNRLNPSKYATRDIGVKWNFFLTILFIILIPSYIFYYSSIIEGVFYFNLLALMIIYFITRTEEKYGYLPKSYAKHLYLIITIFFLAVLSFQIIPISDLLISSIIFFIGLYFSLELFAKFGYYEKKNVLIIQNILALASFYCIAYLFFKDILFGITPIDTVNTFMVNYILPGLIGSLFSLYLLYFRYFFKESWKNLRTGVICNILAIIGLSFYLFNINLNIINVILSVIGFSILYILLSGFNYVIHLFTKENLANNVYNTIWILDFGIFSAMLFETLTSEINLLTIVPDFLILSTLILCTLWFGRKIGKLSEENYFKLFNIIGFLLIIEIFILSSQFLIEEVFPAQIEYKVLAYFISTCITALIVNIGAPSKSPTISKAKNVLNIFTVMFGWFLLEMFYFLANYLNIYGLIIFSSIVTTLPVGFFVYIKVLDKKRLFDYLFLTLNIICLTSFSFIAHFIVLNELDIFFGFTLLILSLIISYIGIGKLGVKLGYISNDFYIKFVKLMYYPIGILLFLVFFSLFLELFNDPFLSFLLASAILGAMTNFTNLIFKTIEKINTRITILTLFYAVLYASTLLIQSFVLIPYTNLYEWYVYLYMALVLIQLMCYIPFKYLAAKKIMKIESYFKYSYYSLFALIVLVFLLISSFFFYFIYSEFPGLYFLALIADTIYITIAFYNHIKRGLAKHYLPVIHLSKKAKIILYTVLFSEFYTFLLNLILLFFPQPMETWQLWLSSYFAFVIITLIIIALANNLIIFSSDFSRRLNFTCLLFTSVIASYLSANFIAVFFVNPLLKWDIIILTFLIFALLPLYYSINEHIFQRLLSKTSVYINGILISLFIIVLPTLFALEFSLVETFFPFIVISTIALIYCFLKYIEYIFDELNIKQGQRIILKTVQLFCWNLLSVFVAYTVFITFTPDVIDQMFYIVLCASLITFFIINLNSLPIIEDIKQRVFENEELKLDFYKIYKIYEFYKNISFFAFIFSLSGLISTFLSPFSYLIGDLIPLLFLSPEIIQFELLFLITLILLVVTNSIEIEYQKTRTWIILICWAIIKGTICGYIYLYFIDTPILAWSISILIFSVFSPITMHFIKNIRLVFGTTNKLINSILIISFYSSLITLYLTYFSNLGMNVFFSENLVLFWFLLICNVILYFEYVITRLKHIYEGDFEFNLLKLYFKSSLVLCLFIFIDFSYINLILWFISAIILLSRRNYNVIIRYSIYILFTLSAYIYIINSISFILPSEWRYSTIVLNISFLSVLFISILTNYRKVNDVEKFVIYLTLSFLSFILFTLIPEFSIIPGLLYNSTFSLLIFLVLTGNHYYQKGDSRYKLFIRPCIVLAVFDFTSFLFYGLLFNYPPFSPDYNSILSFTATFSLTGFTFVSLYHESPQRFRRLSFFIVLPLLILCVPVFVYYFTYATFPSLRTSVIPLTISLNVGILFFFVAIGLYQWKFSRAIWKTGFWAWILFPIVNYAIIDQSLANLGLRSLELFGFINIPASTLLAITICIVLSFPFWYSWIKSHFTTILFATWIINLGLLYWFSQFLFYGNDLLINSSFLIFAFILLMPLVYKLKIWRVLMAFWILFTIITISFIDFFFLSLGLESPMVLSIDISVLGLSFIFLSYFPNMKNKRNLSLLVAYLILMMGISMMIYQVILISVLPGDPLGALYLTMIIISGSSFSSRILKINKIVMNFLISWTLVISFTLITFHIFSLIFPSDIGALYFSLTVGGLTFFIFNRYKMLWGSYENFMPISSFIAFIAVSLGASLSISSLILNLILLDNPYFLVVAVFLFMNIIFLSFKLKERRFILSYLLPIPITSLILHFLLFIEPLSGPIYLATLGIIAYSLINQAFKVKVKFKAILRLILYLDSFILSLLLLPFPDTLLNFFISMSILFVLTAFDSSLSKKQKYWYIVLLNLISYISSTVFLFCYLNVILLELFDYAIWLNSFIFLLLQKYTVYIFYTVLKSLNKYDLEKLTRYKFILNFILSNSLYFLISLFGSLSLGSLIANYFSLIEISSLFLGMTLFCLFYFVFNSVFNKNVKNRIRDGIRSSLFIAFQATLLGLAFTLGLFDLLQFNLIVFNLTIIVFLVMQFYTVRTIFSFLSHFTWLDSVKALRIQQLIDNLLINSIFILLSLLGSSLFTISILQFYNISLYLLLFSFFVFLLNGTLNKTIEKSLKDRYLLVPSYIAMQIFSLSFMVEMMLLSDVTLFIFWLSFIALIETVMGIYPLNIVRKYTKIEGRKAIISRSFKIIDFCLYLEITMLTFGLFYYNLGQEPFQSVLYSQLVLFGLSILEIFVFKRLKDKFGYVMHLLSYVIISGALAYLIFIFSLSEFLILLIILMQFYSNYAYYKMKKDINQEKTETFQMWAVRRQRIIGNTFYAVLVFLVSRFLLFDSGYEIQTSLFLISVLLHVIVLFDRGILIFLGRLSMSLIVISLILVNIFSIPALLTWVFSTIFSYRLIPLVIIIFELELFYLTMLTHKWNKFKNLIISILYFNLATWPLYFLIFSLEGILLDFNLILLTLFLLFVLIKVDQQVNALSKKISEGISSTALVILGFGIPIDIFILLQTFYPTQVVLNIAFSALVGSIELGFISKPYKKKRVVSFFYTLSILIEILVIASEINIPALGYSILVLGTLIYLYMFLLEELKEFFSHIVDYLAKGLEACKSFIKRIITSIYNFLKKNYVTLKIIFAASIAILLGYVSTILPIFGDLLPYNYASLFGLAVFGLIIGLFPGTKTEDPDKIFKTRMIRFSTVWFGITIFIFMIIIPVIDPLFQAILILSSFLILGLILAIYVWRIEKKQKISIKWRLYITVVLIVLLIIWAILLVMLYLTA